MSKTLSAEHWLLTFCSPSAAMTKSHVERNILESDIKQQRDQQGHAWIKKGHSWVKEYKRRYM